MGYLTMVDSAFPLRSPPEADITLIYCGGDTVHRWTDADIDAVGTGWLWPCWVRSNPGQVLASVDVANCIAWLREYGVPKGTAVILDLETAVDTGYVNAFNTGLRNAGWLCTKYGQPGLHLPQPADVGRDVRRRARRQVTGHHRRHRRDTVRIRRALRPVLGEGHRPAVALEERAGT